MQKNAINGQFCDCTQNGAMWGLIASFLTNQNAGSTIDLKMNIIECVIRSHQTNKRIQDVCVFHSCNQHSFGHFGQGYLRLYATTLVCLV